MAIEKDVGETLLRAVKNLPDLIKSSTSDSYISYTNSTRVEPIVLVDPKLNGQEHIVELMQTLTNLFSGYYLQAVAVSGVIGDVKVMDKLGKLNPNQNPMDSMISAAGSMLAAGTECYTFKLPNYKRPNETYHVSKEDFEPNAQTAQSNITDKAIGQIRDVDNLITGKLLQVQIQVEDKTISIPVQVRLIPVSVPSPIFVAIFGQGGYKNTTKERFHRWRAGELSFFNDLLLCNDLVEERRKLLKQDKSGVFKAMVARKRNSRLAFWTGNPSIANASNIAIIPASTAVDVEREIGGKLSNFKARQRIFEVSSLMLLAVYDSELDEVTIYHRGIELPTQCTTRELKTVAKGSGPDIMSILDAFNKFKAPQF